MKKDLLIVPTYIAVTLFLTAFIACFFVLYPMPGIDAAFVSTYIFDTMVFSSLSILPLISVLSLALVLLRSVKIGVFSILEFLTYIFLCLLIWLIVIPLFIFTVPEQQASLKILGQSPSLAQVFFQQETIPILAQNIEAFSLSLPKSVVQMFSDLVFLRDSAREFARQGRVSYLMFASLGLALSSLVALRYVSSWKLINVAVILFLWTLLVWLNIQVYKEEWNILFGSRWNAVIINGAFTFILFIIGIVCSAKRKKIKKEAE